MAWNIQKENQIAELSKEQTHFREVVFPEMEKRLKELGITVEHGVSVLHNATEIIALLAPFSRVG